MLVSRAVAEAIDDVRRGLSTDIQFTTDFVPGPNIETDRIRLTQIVSNLVGNAAKFAHQDVHCSAHPAGDH